MPLDKPYTQLVDVQKETKNSDSELDAWYIECINRASRWVDEYCQRDFWFHDHLSAGLVCPRDRVMEDCVLLPFPILTLTGVTVHYDKAVGAVAGNSIDLNTLHWETNWPNLWCDSGVFGDFPFKGFLTLTGTFGYPLADTDPTTTPPPTLPQDVRKATTLVAAALSSENHKEALGLDGQRTELLETNIPTEVYALLKKWREYINFLM